MISLGDGRGGRRGGRSQEHRISPGMPSRAALAQMPEVQALGQHIGGFFGAGGSAAMGERAMVAGTDGSVEQVTANIAEAVQQHGPAPGAKKMMKAEQAAAEEAIRTGLYGVWRNASSQHDFCGRIGPLSRCFCGHDYSAHTWKGSRKEIAPSCNNCPCKQFRYIPRRPEEIGEAWLVRRRGFDINVWRPKCKCGHGHDAHDPTTTKCPVGMGRYQSAWLCITCDGKWEDHESLWESEEERRMMRRPVGQAFMPLASTPGIQQMVFDAPESGPRSLSLPHRPRPERSVKLMQERCPNYGGAAGSLEDAFPPRGGHMAGSLADAFPPRNVPRAGSLEDAFPPRNGGRPGLGMGSLEDAFPPNVGAAFGSLEDTPLPRRRTPDHALGGDFEDAFPPRLPSGGRRGAGANAKPAVRPPRSRTSTPGSSGPRSASGQRALWGDQQ